MATYVNDLRLKEIATGDESGTWGTSTNTNLELIADAFSYATKDCFASDADATETMADGVADEIRSTWTTRAVNIFKPYSDIEGVNALNSLRGSTIKLSNKEKILKRNIKNYLDEFQNLTKQQLLMVLGRLGKGSIMIFCGDKDQIDLKFANDSAIHDVPKLRGSKYVYEVMLKDNHRHEALDEIFDLLK